MLNVKIFYLILSNNNSNNNSNNPFLFSPISAKGSQPAEGCEGDGEGSSYYVRLGSLSAKLRHRSYERAVTKVRDARQHTRDSIAQLHLTMDAVGRATLAKLRKMICS